MNMEFMKEFNNNESMFKKGNLFEAIFGGKMQDLLDKVTKFLGGDIIPQTSDTAPNISHSSIQSQSEFSQNSEVNVKNMLGDMTDLASKYPNEAWAKNNNPSGITWPLSNTLRSQLDGAGIRYELGSKRPSNEGGNYVKFATMDEGIRAKKIVLMKGDMVIRERLAKRVGTADKVSNYRYADGILKAAGVDGSKRFSELTESEMNALMMKQIKQESSGLYKELIARNITPIASDIA